MLERYLTMEGGPFSGTFVCVDKENKVFQNRVEKDKKRDKKLGEEFILQKVGDFQIPTPEEGFCKIIFQNSFLHSFYYPLHTIPSVFF